MPTTCKIKFENNSKKIFFSGQTLYITVRLKLTEELKVSGIYIQLRGIAHVRFVMDDFRRAGHYVSDEMVLNMRKSLASENVLPVGTHDYSFTCTLPDDLPSTFAGTLGYIKYSAQVVLRISFWPDKKFEEEFTVFKPVNLNDYPSLRNEVLRRQTKHNSIGNLNETSRLGIVCISGRMAAGGYANGQNVDLHVSVNNESSYSLSRFVVSLTRRTMYLKGNQHKTEFTVVKKRTMANWRSEQQTYMTFPTANFKIPAMIPPTDMETSKIIKYQYFLTVNGFLNSSEYAAFISLDLPIMIGTMPFDNTRNVASALPIALAHDIWAYEPRPMDPSAPAFPDDDSVSIRTYASTPPPFPDDDFDLPTYEDALLMDEEFDVNLQSIENTFAQLHVKSTSK